MDVGALRDRGKCRLFRLGHVVKVAGVGLEVLDVWLDIFGAIAEFLAGVDDRRDFEAADVADRTCLRQHRRRRAGQEGDLRLLHVVLRDVGDLVAERAADDREFYLREALGNFQQRRLRLSAHADHEIALAGKVGQRLLHLGVFDVLDHLYLDGGTVLLLGGSQAVEARFHPAFVRFRTGNENADGDRRSGPCRAAGQAGCKRGRARDARANKETTRDCHMNSPSEELSGLC